MIPAEDRTLADVLQMAPETGGRLTFHRTGDVTELDGPTLRDAALRGATSLIDLGIRPGDRVGILGSNHPRWAIWAFATWVAGGVVVPLAYPLRIRSAETFRAGLERLAEAAALRGIVAEPGLLAHVSPGLGLSWDLELPQAPARPVELHADETAVIQFTSGSGGDPKGVRLSHRAVLATLQADLERSGMRTDELVHVSWLPFFHDWGLFGYLVWTVLMGVRTHVLPVERFARDPLEWLRLVGEVRATETPAPSSAWRAALGLAAHRPEGIDLSSLRYCALSSEAIDPRVVDAMNAEGAGVGLASGRARGAYGMSETVMGVTGTHVDESMRIDSIDRDAFATSRRAIPSDAGDALRVASSGRPVPGSQTRIVDPDGRQMADRHLGEIQVNGVALFDGYLDGTDGRLDGGWFPTGDLGYLDGGELFVSGRIKDVIIVMGRNYSAQDVEWAAERSGDVRAGRCVAFSGGEREGELVVVAEPVNGRATDDVRSAVWGAVADGIGIVPSEVLIVPKGTIPFTTSGKPRRSAVRQAYAEGALKAAIASGGKA